MRRELAAAGSAATADAYRPPRSTRAASARIREQPGEIRKKLLGVTSGAAIRICEAVYLTGAPFRNRSGLRNRAADRMEAAVLRGKSGFFDPPDDLAARAGQIREKEYFYCEPDDTQYRHHRPCRSR